MPSAFMLVYLIRHAHAVTEEENPSRPLSAQGHLQVAQLCEFFRANGVFKPASIWHSPLRRASETAALLNTGAEVDAALVETPGLLPADDPREICSRLSRLESVETLAIVGHEPHLSAMATLMVRGKVRPLAFDVKKGTVIAFERGSGVHKKSGERRWRVSWQIHPELLQGPRKVPAL